MTAHTIDHQDAKFLQFLAEFRILSARQLSVLADVHIRTIRRRVEKLTLNGHLNSIHRTLRGQSGRPEKIYYLSDKGIKIIRNELLADVKLSKNKVGWKSQLSLEHQLSVNWTLIAVILLERNSLFTMKYLSHTSPFLPTTKSGVPFIQDMVKVDEFMGQEESFIPDAVLTISHQKQSLLFFIEVDRSTEPIISRNGKANSINNKIWRYHHYLESKGYKRYEEYFRYPYNGFRLLLICDSQKRMEQLHSLTRDFPSPDFIWLTTEEDILLHGIGSTIWSIGREDEATNHSILGPKYAFEFPIKQKE